MRRLLLLIPTAVLAHVAFSWVLAIGWAFQLGDGAINPQHLAPLFAQAVILDVDWDVVLSIVLGLAGIGYVVIDHRRTAKLDELAQYMGERIAAIEAVIHSSTDLIDRVARLESTSTDAMTIEQRLAGLEVRAERDEHLEERIAGIGERVAVVETKHDLIDRLARVETSIEHQHIAERLTKLEAATEDETE